ncbi:hypothetical protein OUZ56_002984 [Daphnia magna]|uniref:Uncharacterized protein n=1 Tax=Daphnia magna TaxID=35525 RepID=A0ABR0A7D5_9CRUS|nr:hypothetical protein OUZ56_002984 [Daphnia magna]
MYPAPVRIPNVGCSLVKITDPSPHLMYRHVIITRAFGNDASVDDVNLIPLSSITFQIVYLRRFLSSLKPRNLFRQDRIS